MSTKSYFNGKVSGDGIVAIAAAIALVVLALGLNTVWERLDGAVDPSPVQSFPATIANHNTAASQPLGITQNDIPQAGQSLNDKSIDLIAAKVIENVTAKLSEVSPKSNTEVTDSAKAAEPLKRELTELRKEVKELTEFTQSLSLYTKEIEHSLSSVDMSLSTPGVLRNKLNQQQNGIKP